MSQMTLRRLAGYHARAVSPLATGADIDQLAFALDQRRRERGSSKLSRRLARKGRLGRRGAF